MRASRGGSGRRRSFRPFLGDASVAIDGAQREEQCLALLRAPARGGGSRKRKRCRIGDAPRREVEHEGGQIGGENFRPSARARARRSAARPTAGSRRRARCGRRGRAAGRRRRATRARFRAASARRRAHSAARAQARNRSTMRTPSMVSEVSAIDVASTTLRRPGGAGAIARSCIVARRAHHKAPPHRYPDRRCARAATPRCGGFRPRRAERPAANPRRRAAPARPHRRPAARSAAAHRARDSASRPGTRGLRSRSPAHRRAASPTRAPSSVADMTRSLRSSRRPCCTSRASAKPEIGVERALMEFVEQNRGDARRASGSSRMSRVNTPSVTTSIRVAPRDFASRSARDSRRCRRPSRQGRRHARGRGAGGEPARLEHEDLLPLPPRLRPASTSGTRVVLPAPGGATSTAAFARAEPRSVPAAPHRSAEATVHVRSSGRSADLFPVEGARADEDKCIARRLAGGEITVQVLQSERMPVKAEKRRRQRQNCRNPPSSARPLKKGDHVFLVDGSVLHLPRLSRTAAAQPQVGRLQVNAVLGFCNMLWKLLRDMKPEERPTHLAVVFDKSEKTFRTEMYPDYKAHRPEPPDDLRPQFAFIREAVQRLRPALPGAGRLRGRRPDRDLCAARLRGGRDRDHRVLRQGPDAARDRLRRHVRHDEGQARSASPR